VCDGVIGGVTPTVGAKDAGAGVLFLIQERVTRLTDGEVSTFAQRGFHYEASTAAGHNHQNKTVVSMNVSTDNRRSMTLDTRREGKTSRTKATPQQ
jgi:hypothetical protein